MSDHRGEGRRRGPCGGREGGNLQLIPSRPQTHLPGLKEVLQVVAGHPVPAEPEDKVFLHVHVQWRLGDRHRLAEHVAQAKVGQHRRPKALSPACGRRRHGEQARLARQRQAQRSRQARAMMRRPRVQRDGHAANALRSR